MTTANPPRNSTPAKRWIPNLSLYSGPLYRRLANAIVDGVATGQLKTGDKLPTHRELAAHLRVTLRTVTRAYGETARIGVTCGTAGSGTFVVAKQSPAAILPRDVPMPAGTIDLALSVVPLARNLNFLRRGIAAVAAVAKLEDLLTYVEPHGALHHREAGSVWARQRGLTAEPALVSVCSGAQNAMMVALMHIARPGNKVLTEALNRPGLIHLAKHLHLRLQGVAMDAEGMLPDALEAQCRAERPAAVVVTPTGQNPTTAGMSATRRSKIAEVLCRHGIRFVEDDINGHAVANSPPPIAHLIPSLGYYVCGISKCVSPGLRLAYLISPLAACRALSEILLSTSWSASSIAAEIGAHLIGNGTALRLAAWHRKESTRRFAQVAAALPNFELSTVAGVYHGWLIPPSPWRGTDLANRLAEAGVHVSPAKIFSVDGAPAPEAIRIAVGGELTDAKLDRALRIIRSIASQVFERPSPGFSNVPFQNLH